MKTLLLMRHAKSSWKHPELADHERPLAKNGLRDAHRMGELIERQELIPQRVFSSSAVRATKTASIFCKMCGCGENIVVEDSLYLAEADTLIDTLKALPDDLERVLLVGHNPGLEALLQILCARVESLPTAVIAYITLPIKQWSELSVKTEGELVEIWRPKELPEEHETHKKKKKDVKSDEDKTAKKAEKETKDGKEKKKPKKKKEEAEEASAKKAEVTDKKKDKPKKDK